MILHVRKAKKEDLSDVINMIQELADFEEMPDGPKLKIEDLIRDGCYDENLTDRPLFYCFIVEHHEDVTTTTTTTTTTTATKTETTNKQQTTLQPLIRKKLIGYGLCFFTYSTWNGKSLLMEDIYIKPNYRKLGAGKLLFKEVTKFAIETKCTRLDFHVLNWNPAKGFYEKLGANNLTKLESWQFYRMDKNAMEKLINDEKL